MCYCLIMKVHPHCAGARGADRACQCDAHEYVYRTLLPFKRWRKKVRDRHTSGLYVTLHAYAIAYETAVLSQTELLLHCVTRLICCSDFAQKLTPALASNTEHTSISHIYVSGNVIEDRGVYPHTSTAFLEYVNFL